MAKRTTNKRAIRGKVRAHDPFELIRWLAMSQPDPRKALAELVQNSLDAGARQIRVIRARVNRSPSIRIVDDGEGVIPELERAEALRYIATHIGHSRKRDLSPQQRMDLMTQGQYGIGLLGFWSIGEQLHIRSAVPGQKPMSLILRRDSPEFEIDLAGGRLPLEERWTEVFISDVHRDAVSNLGGRRIAEYLAAELRGQLLSRDVELVIEDRMARGRSQNSFRSVRRDFSANASRASVRSKSPGIRLSNSKCTSALTMIGSSRCRSMLPGRLLPKIFENWPIWIWIAFPGLTQGSAVSSISQLSK